MLISASKNSPTLTRLKKNFNIRIQLRAEIAALNEGSSFQSYFTGLVKLDRALQAVRDAGYQPTETEIQRGITITPAEARAYRATLR